MFHLSLSAFACGVIAGGGGGGSRGGRRGVVERIMDVMLVVGDLKEKEPIRGTVILFYSYYFFFSFHQKKQYDYLEMLFSQPFLQIGIMLFSWMIYYGVGVEGGRRGGGDIVGGELLGGIPQLFGFVFVSKKLTFTFISPLSPEKHKKMPPLETGSVWKESR